MGNRYVLINRIEKETNSNYAVIYDSYEAIKSLYIKTDLNKLLGKHKEYIPYVSVAGRPYPTTTELTSLTHQLKNEYEALDVYNELEKKYSNVVSKFFSEKLLEKYIVKDASTDDYRLPLELPNEADFSLKELDTDNSRKDIHIYINKYQGEELCIKNLIFPDYFVGKLRIFLLWKKSIHIENLVASSTKIEIHRLLDSLGSEASKSFIIDNIECASLINYDFYNIDIKNFKINKHHNASFNQIIGVDYRNGVTAKITIENLNINTPKMIRISGNVYIKNRNSDNISDGGNNIKQNLFKDKKFVITGAISGYSNRNTIIDIIEMNGGKVSSTVNKETDYLLCEGLSNSSKSKKALQYGTKIINGDDFREMYKTSR